MNPMVEDYLRKCDERDRQKDAEHRKKVLLAAGLTTEVECECSEYEYYNTPLSKRLFISDDENGTSFRILKDAPIEVTDEEFAAIEKATETSETAFAQEKEQRSGAATFFLTLAWILWIGGLIVAIVTGNQKVPHTSTSYYGRTTTTYTNEFSFTTFMTTFVSYVIYGAFCMAAAELFKKLQTIVNLLRKNAGPARTSQK